MHLSNRSHLTGAPININYVFEPRRSLSDVKVRSLSASYRPALPFKAVGYDFSIEQGLRPKPPHSNRWVTPSLLMIGSLLTVSPLLGWLNSPVALISLETNAFSLQSTPVVIQSYVPAPAALLKKVNLSHPTITPKTTPDKVDCEKMKIGTDTEMLAVHCKIKTSLSDAVQQADLSDHTVDQLVQIFQWDIDFDRDVQSGDQFSIVYEPQPQPYLFDGDKKNGDGDILAAEFVNQGNVYRAVRYTDSAGTTSYYTPTGFHLQKLSLFDAPLRYTRISSPFGYRKHPISKKYSLHKGVDYAAPRGRTIVAAGDATVKFVGRKGGYGKSVVLEHHQRVSTLYAHLLKYAKGLRVGDKISQGQVIGYVGRSGRATGYHLHYEIQLDDVAIDPSLVADSHLSLPIINDHKPHFFGNTQLLLTQLDTLSPSASTMVAQSAPVGSHSNTSVD
jgi:murein DD-endopeptidase MepM/ murein hydrolase activator NlpD